MIRLIAIIILFLISCKALAIQDFSQVSQDPKIQQTLTLLKKHKETRQTFRGIMGDNLTGKPIKIMFYDLSAMDEAYKRYDALTCKHKSGTLYIFINTIHRDAPIEAIACLLVHETMHQDDYISQEEEVQAWTAEAKAWAVLKKNHKEADNNIPLIKRLNSIEKMYKDAGCTSKIISEEIYKNIAYKHLPEN